MFLILFPDKTKIAERLIPSKNYFVNEKIIPINPDLESSSSQKPFEWTVEKGEGGITKIALPADPSMSTADELFSAMNDYRKSHAVQQVNKNDLLCSIAQNRANEQLANGKLDGHLGFGKYAKDQTEFSQMGEVLFGGVQPQYGVHIVEYGWDRSLTGHKEAIQDPSWNYGCGGIAGYYAVFIFGTK